MSNVEEDGCAGFEEEFFGEEGEVAGVVGCGGFGVPFLRYVGEAAGGGEGEVGVFVDDEGFVLDSVHSAGDEGV